MSDYLRYKAALQGQRLPAALLDMELLEENARAILRRAGSYRVRIASKSIRSIGVLRHLFSLSERFQGLMTFTAEETLFLARDGFRDLLLGYPTFDEVSVRSLLELPADSKITFMVDSRAQLDFLARFGRPVRVCLDIDMSTPFGFLWFGVRRSPLRTLAQVQELVSDLPSNVQLVGVMGYEAQVAGLGDKILPGPIVRLLQRRSRADYARRRGQIAAWLRERFPLELMNGGGTGSLEWSIRDPGVDEVTAGSGFYSPGLFDHYSRFHHRPALCFATTIVRAPKPGMWTALGGGYTASGEIHRNKRPVPYLPPGMKLIEQEGCGEVQTPFTYQGHPGLQEGDVVLWRHAKAGELCERFNQLLLLRAGQLVGTLPTYRGQGQAFL